MIKAFKEWFFGKPKRRDKNQHAFRQPGEVSPDEEDKMSYEPGWWQSTGMWTAKAACWAALAGVVVTGGVVGKNYGCAAAEANKERIEAEKQASVAKTEAATKEHAAKEAQLKAEAKRASAEAEKIRANAPCVDFIKLITDGDASIKCPHAGQKMSTKWEGGKFIVTCVCPDSVGPTGE